jgi:EmrB/QacA subfamily drug resistance transporter
MLIIARAAQGIGGAITAAVSLSLVMNIFTRQDERAKAMGYFGFIAAGGGAIGVLLGGFITSAFNWHWNFLINVPIGILVILFSRKFLPSTKSDVKPRSLDVWGAITITSSLMLMVYAIVNGNQAGWTSPQTIGMITVAAVLMAAFFVIESRVKAPLLPLKLFKIRSLVSANAIGILWAGAMFAWFFLSALYLQLVLHYTPLQVGLAFLPANLIMAIFSIVISARLVMRFGIRKPLVTGLLLASLGLFLFVVAPVGGSFFINVLPSMILLGVGAGMAFNPVLLAAMSDVKPDESGLASGIVNTSFMMGGALGLAVLASLAASRTMKLITEGEAQIAALNGGYHLAFLVGALFAFLAAVIGILFLKTDKVPNENVSVH